MASGRVTHSPTPQTEHPPNGTVGQGPTWPGVKAVKRRTVSEQYHTKFSECFAITYSDCLLAKWELVEAELVEQEQEQVVLLEVS